MQSDFPACVLEKILSFLPLRDVLQSSSISRSFCDASEIVYHRRRKEVCARYVPGEKVAPWNYPGIRHHLFSKYGKLVGLWKIVNTAYGGLIKVKFDGYQLIGVRYNPPPALRVDEPLKPEEVFIIYVDSDENCQCLCFRGNKGSHKTSIELESEGFVMNCKEREKHSDSDANSKEFDTWACERMALEKENEAYRNHSSLTSRYVAHSLEVLLKCSPLSLPQFQHDAIIQPGLFKGSYGGHGIELVLLTYNNEEKSAVITKITGDDNVPAGNITIHADLNSPIAETEESCAGDQGCVNSVGATSSGKPRYRFTLPGSIYFSGENYPEFCQQRFHSHCQIAEHGHVNPRFIPGEWIIFDENTFGHIFLSIHSFNMYKRFTETF